MAIVGLQNVPVLESSLLRESQPSSSSSGRHVDQNGSGTRASSILQMWRELEDECVVSGASGRQRAGLQRHGSDGLSTGATGSNLSQSQDIEDRISLVEDSCEVENDCRIVPQGQMGSQEEHDDRPSTASSEQSHDFGEVERERVRQIFREWMNTGLAEQASDGPHVHRSSRGQWLGETERERVRIVREWIHMSTQQRNYSVSNRDEQHSDVSSQIECVRDGQVVDQINEVQTENNRRGIRRLCGRQALLDLLAKKGRERERELQGLSERRPVSGFSFRNRIQALLRCRVWQNKSFAEQRRPNSTAESELGLLRRQHTVSDLREGFLSRLDSNVHLQASDFSDSSTNNNINCFRDDETQTNGTIEAFNDRQEQTGPVGEASDEGPSADPTVGSLVYSTEEVNLPETELENDHQGGEWDQEEYSVLAADPVDGAYNLISHEESSGDVGVESSLHEENHDGFPRHNDTEVEDVFVHAVSLSDHRANNTSEAHGMESPTQLEDWQEDVTVVEERETDDSVLSHEWRADASNTGQERSADLSRTDDGQQNSMHGPYWNDDVSQGTAGHWLEFPSGPGDSSAGRVDQYYISDDDNVNNMELRELVNRRRVSSLLSSGFRESLDQLIQSYVQRQNHAPDDWELHDMPPSLGGQDQEQLDAVQNEDPGAPEENSPILPESPVMPQPNWRDELHRYNWSRHNIRHRAGTEWEMINDLRIDMARLQQRLNNMQEMLEACMAMQFELQRSVRQEVSAALNRTATSSGSIEAEIPKDGSKWDRVRKGICCICCDGNIDSLLYRCGHMCTCAKCANILVEGNGKCPMCRAPVIEVIRAYTIQ